MSAERQQYYNELASPSKHSSLYDPLLHYTHSDYNGLVDLQQVQRQRRASASKQRQRRASQQCSVAAYQMLLTSLQAEQSAASSIASTSPRHYFVQTPAERSSYVVDPLTNAVSAEIDQFEAANQQQLANTLHIK